MCKLFTRDGFIVEVYHELPDYRTIVDVCWGVECDHMSFFDRPRYSGHDSFKTVLSKARKEKLKNTLK